MILDAAAGSVINGAALKADVLMETAEPLYERLKENTSMVESKTGPSLEEPSEVVISRALRPASGWRDVTKEFCQAARCLKLGELFHHSDFTLLEAMSAIEMMDPKMDAGMHSSSGSFAVEGTKLYAPTKSAPNGSNNCISANGVQDQMRDASVASLKVEGLTSAEVRAVLDSSVRLLVSWLEGHCLAQTVYTNRYLHLKLNLKDAIPDRNLRAVVLASVKLVAVIKDIIYHTSAFEEEDFHGMTYTFYLGPDVPDSKVCSLLKECEDELLKRSKKIRAGAAGLRQTSNSTFKLSGAPNDVSLESDLVCDSASVNDSLEDVSALQVRMRVLRMLLSALCILESQPAKATGFVEARKALVAAAESLRSLREHFGISQNPEVVVSSVAPTGETSFAFEKDQIQTKRSSVKNCDEDDDTFPAVSGFDANLNQRLLPSTFPRHTKVASCRRAYGYLAAMVDRMLEAMQVLQLSSYDQVLEFFEEFSKKAPCVLSRSVGQLLYIPQPGMVFGVTKPADVLRDAVRSFCRPPVLLAKTPLSEIPECRKWVESFLARCVHPMFGLLQVAGHNRARQREKAARLLDDLSQVQEEAEQVDARLVAAHRTTQDLHTPAFHWFSTWLMTYVLRTQIRYLLSGFELELYAVHEYPYIFWYLYDYLYRFLVTVLSQTDQYLLECDKRLKKKLKKDSRLGLGGSAKPLKKIPGVAKGHNGYHQREILLHQVRSLKEVAA